MVEMDVPAARNPPSEEDAFAPGVNEDIALENLGYRQELQRTFSLLDMVGFSFSIVTW
jgi:hypothetical protein